MDLLQKARALYLAGETHQALELAQKAAENHARDAEAWWLLACISRHADLPGASDEAFKRAAALSKRKPEPIRVSAEEFVVICDEALASLSTDAKRRLGKAGVNIHALPTPQAVRAGTSPDALTTRTREPEDELTLYQANFESRCGSATELRKLVARTLARA